MVFSLLFREKTRCLPKERQANVKINLHTTTSQKEWPREERGHLLKDNILRATCVLAGSL